MVWCPLCRSGMSTGRVAWFDSCVDDSPHRLLAKLWVCHVWDKPLQTLRCSLIPESDQFWSWRCISWFMCPPHTAGLATAIAKDTGRLTLCKTREWWSWMHTAKVNQLSNSETTWWSSISGITSFCDLPPTFLLICWLAPWFEIHSESITMSKWHPQASFRNADNWTFVFLLSHTLVHLTTSV